MSKEALRSPEVARIERERDLYLQLLKLGAQDRLRPFLKDALALIVELGDARQGYLELYDDDDGNEPQWSMSHGFSDDQVQCVRANISKGIIAEALATGQPIATRSAVKDPRFAKQDSVIIGPIEAVLCAPIGDDPPCGVLYLQGRQDSELASEDGCARAMIFTRHLAPLVNRLLAEERRARAEDPTRARRETLHLPHVIGRSPALAAVLRQVFLFAPLNETVLITGESGTGKSQLARVIHDNSPRAARRFLTMNCGGLTEELASSQLFGHKRNAFTGATDKDRKGVFEEANGGTLFLDEISEMSQSVQVRFLHVLQEKEVTPLGAEEQPPVRVDTRVIAATNADLDRAVHEGRFRADLLSRLNGLTLRMPSLAERREDIRDLVTFFCAQHSEISNLPRLELSRAALRAVESADWLPGNIRDLDKAALRALLNAKDEGAMQLERRHFFPETAVDVEESGAPTWRDATRRFQKELLSDTLEATQWSITAAADRLEVAKSHVHNKINEFKLKRERR